MPYKDGERKREWERLHRTKRLARRRVLRQIEAANTPDQPKPKARQSSDAGFLFPLIAASAVAIYNPKLAIGAGGLTLVLAAYFKKDRNWWIVGLLLLVAGVFIQWNLKTERE